MYPIRLRNPEDPFSIESTLYQQVESTRRTQLVGTVVFLLAFQFVVCAGLLSVHGLLSAMFLLLSLPLLVLPVRTFRSRAPLPLKLTPAQWSIGDFTRHPSEVRSAHRSGARLIIDCTDGSVWTSPPLAMREDHLDALCNTLSSGREGPEAETRSDAHRALLDLLGQA